MTEDASEQPNPEKPATDSPFAALYDRAVASLLDVSVTDEWVDTGVGRTHVLTAGDPSAPPVVVLQGGNITNPVTLAWFGSLADEYCLVAPDTPGQPGKSTTSSHPRVRRVQPTGSGRSWTSTRKVPADRRRIRGSRVGT